MANKKYTTWESLPEVVTATHIADYFGISRRRVYELFQLKEEFGGIPNFEVGNSKRVEKADLKRWIDQKKLEERNACS